MTPVKDDPTIQVSDQLQVKDQSKRTQSIDTIKTLLIATKQKIGKNCMIIHCEYSDRAVLVRERLCIFNILFTFT